MEMELHAIKSVIQGRLPLKSLKQSPKLKVRRRRRWPAGEWGESIALPSRLGTLLERHELPQQGPGQSPGEKRIWCILSVTEPFWLQDIVNIWKMQNNNNVQLPLIFQIKPFLVFLVAFASIRFIGPGLNSPGVFIVCCYLRLLRRHSQKLESQKAN